MTSSLTADAIILPANTGTTTEAMEIEQQNEKIVFDPNDPTDRRVILICNKEGNNNKGNVITSLKLLTQTMTDEKTGDEVVKPFLSKFIFGMLNGEDPTGPDLETPVNAPKYLVQEFIEFAEYHTNMPTKKIQRPLELNKAKNIKDIVDPFDHRYLVCDEIIENPDREDRQPAIRRLLELTELANYLDVPDWSNILHAQAVDICNKICNDKEKIIKVFGGTNISRGSNSGTIGTRMAQREQTNGEGNDIGVAREEKNGKIAKIQVQ